MNAPGDDETTAADEDQQDPTADDAGEAYWTDAR